MVDKVQIVEIQQAEGAKKQDLLDIQLQHDKNVKVMKKLQDEIGMFGRTLETLQQETAANTGNDLI